MSTTLTGVAVSPVNMEDRKALGIKPGDTVRVHQKIEEKGKTRIQVFDGIVLARKHGNEPGATFTVRKIASGVGVEKIFPLYSPMIDKIEIVKRAKVRRAKLYYIREKVAREIKRQMRRMSLVSLASESEAEATARKEAEDAAAAAEAEAKAAEEAAQKAEEEVTAEVTGEEAGDTTTEEPPEESNEESTEADETPAEEEKEEATKKESEDEEKKSA